MLRDVGLTQGAAMRAAWTWRTYIQWAAPTIDIRRYFVEACKPNAVALDIFVRRAPTSRPGRD